MSSGGWVGPGAKSSPYNEEELRQHKAMKRRYEAEEAEKRETENARRLSLGQKPLKDGVFKKIKKLLKRSMM